MDELRNDPERASELRKEVLRLTREYADARWGHPIAFSRSDSRVPVSGKVFDADDVASLVDAALDFWLTAGRFADAFEAEFARQMGARYACLTNSGSSANLLAVTALTAPELGERRLRPGDEVLTAASGFPTTVNPILQNGLVPVFLDVRIPTYNVDATELAGAISPRTKAIVLAHTLGNPFAVDEVKAFADARGLWLIEDCCDALGSCLNGRPVGTFGDLASFSFYPAHHITMGEGGAVITSDPLLKRLVESYRDWGRDCWCKPGHDGTCGRRFAQAAGELPAGYDHKYVYSHIGYNLKATDPQAAVGLSQLQKLSGFIERRRANFMRLYAGLADLDDVLIRPESLPGAEPSWFGFPLTVRPGGPLTRYAVVSALEERKIATRLMFGGNLLRQPAYRDANVKVGPAGLANSDLVMADTFWVGVYPGLGDAEIDYIIETLHGIYGRAGS